MLHVPHYALNFVTHEYFCHSIVILCISINGICIVARPHIIYFFSVVLLILLLFQDFYQKCSLLTQLPCILHWA